MEKFNLEKHWNPFLNKEIVVNCQTEELAKEFLNFCDRQGLKWNDNEDLTLECMWNVYKDNTCYKNNYNGITFSNIDIYIDEEFKIAIFTGFNSTIENENSNNIIKENDKMTRRELITFMSILSEQGVELFDSDGNTKKFGEIMYYLQDEWTNYNEEQKKVLTELLAKLED